MKTITQINQEIDQAKQSSVEAIKYAKSIGADDVEVRIDKSSNTVVSTLKSKLENIEFHQDMAFTVKVLKDKKKGIASTNKINKDSINKVVEEAKYIATITEADEFNGLASKHDLLQKNHNLELHIPSSIEENFLEKLAIECEQGILEAKGECDGAAASTLQSWGVYGNSNGFLEGNARTKYHCSGSAIARAEKIYNSYDFSISRDIAKLTNPFLVGQTAARKALKKVGSKKIKTQNLPVILQNKVASSFISYIASAINGHKIYKKNSFLLDQLDKKIIAKNISIYENPHILGGWNSSYYDKEGVATKARSIVTEGMLQTYLLDSYSSRKLNRTNTGHAGGITNWSVSHNNISYQELIKQMGTGVIITDTIGQGVNLVNGDYSKGAEGFYVENGVILHPVDEITISGNIKDMLLSIQAIDREYDPRKSILSGSILIESMKISGN